MYHFSAKKNFDGIPCFSSDICAFDGKLMKAVIVLEIFKN